jgi:hypothetical protein
MGFQIPQFEQVLPSGGRDDDNAIREKVVRHTKKILMVDRIRNSGRSRVFRSDWTNQIRGFLAKKASNDM